MTLIPAIRTDADMLQYKAELRWQMRAALVAIILLFGPIIAYVIGVAVGTFSTLDCLYLVTPGLAGVATTKAIGANARMKLLPAETPALVAERDAVVATWVGKALPDF